MKLFRSLVSPNNLSIDFHFTIKIKQNRKAQNVFKALIYITSTPASIYIKLDKCTIISHYCYKSWKIILLTDSICSLHCFAARTLHCSLFHKSRLPSHYYMFLSRELNNVVFPILSTLCKLYKSCENTLTKLNQFVKINNHQNHITLRTKMLKNILLLFTYVLLLTNEEFIFEFEYHFILNEKHVCMIRLFSTQLLVKLTILTSISRENFLDHSRKILRYGFKKSNIRYLDCLIELMMKGLKYINNYLKQKYSFYFHKNIAMNFSASMNSVGQDAGRISTGLTGSGILIVLHLTLFFTSLDNTVNTCNRRDSKKTCKNIDNGTFEEINKHNYHYLSLLSNFILPCLSFKLTITSNYLLTNNYDTEIFVYLFNQIFVFELKQMIETLIMLNSEQIYVTNEMSNNLCFNQNNIRLSLNTYIGERCITFSHLKPLNHYHGLCMVCGQNPNSTFNFFHPLLKKFKKTDHMVSDKSTIGVPNLRALSALIKFILASNIEKNPGPKIELTIYTLNCRGLNNIDKFRLVLNKSSSVIKQNPNTVIMLQETMVKYKKYLDLAWRGDYVFTPGTGNSQGCITLLDKGVLKSHSLNIGHRGHAATIEIAQQTIINIYNIYAPNGYARDKRDFFTSIVSMLTTSENENIIVAGDFNLTLNDTDRLNRQTSTGERNIANYVKTELTNLNLQDCWEGFDGMTWRRANSMSRLDRIYVKISNCYVAETYTDWMFCDTDHAAVITKIKSFDQGTKLGPKPCRLNNDIVLNSDTLAELKCYLREQLSTLDPDSNPHFVLEFTKMTIRTKALQISKRKLNEEMEIMKNINDDIKAHECLLKRTTDAEEQNIIILHIQTRINERNELLNLQGTRLAWKSRTKWYNEGEKSNKYFLNLLKSRASNGEMKKLNSISGPITDQVQISNEVNKFYHELYNAKNITSENHTFLNEMFTVDLVSNEAVKQPITISELWAALKPLKDTAPGPDGISHAYLKKLWDIIGPIIVNAWNYSLATNKMPPSHYHSFLKLIPKPGKDLANLKNWRPITLSNCDHKLITRIYNNRLMAAVGNSIVSTQTAYIKSRNITDNIRMINAAIQLANHEPQIKGAVIALDAQKAFDTVNHRYITDVLKKIGLTNFIPIFKLLYQNIRNSVLINGCINGEHPINNGVKQGDALSCTLFILAIEPLIRNVQKCENIKAIESATLMYKWPKVYGYADDITCVIANEAEGKQALFKQYEDFTKISGLRLNAEKTEIYEFGNNPPGTATDINYCEISYSINPVPEIKINGLYLCQNLRRLKELNMVMLIDKMERHFIQWSKRSLSLLGKIQIYKTFGLSQYLYHLNIFEPNPASWKIIYDKINKFLWNRAYTGNTAPPRIKRTTIETPIDKGGFGMLDIRQVVTALRLRRHLLLMENNLHPMHDLINNLVDPSDYMSNKIELDVDEITKLNLCTLQAKRLRDCTAPNWQLESDLILQGSLLPTRIENLVRPRKLRGAELSELKRRGMQTLQDVLASQRDTHLLSKIIRTELKCIIPILSRVPLQQVPINYGLRDKAGTWFQPKQLTSKTIREILYTHNLVEPKILVLDEGTKLTYFKKISCLQNVQNKTKMLRLLHGDVYTAERLKRFKMADSDTCRRCFEKETLKHLLLECPYSIATFRQAGLNEVSIESVLGTALGQNALEIWSEIILSVVFRLHVMPPNILVTSTLKNFANGINFKPNIKKTAERMLRQLQQ
jgi:exonuclease III